MNRIQVISPGGPGAPYYSDFYFDASVDGQEDAQAAAVNQFWAVQASGISGLYTATFNGVVQQIDVTSGDVIGVASATAWSVSGAENTEQLPPANQGLLSLHTGVYNSGRELHGRKNIWGPCENDSTAGKPNGAYIAELVLAAQSLIDANVRWCVYSPTHHVAAVITQAFVAPYWAVLRSRRD